MLTDAARESAACLVWEPCLCVCERERELADTYRFFSQVSPRQRERQTDRKRETDRQTDRQTEEREK
jgi:hypothetical protein